MGSSYWSATARHFWRYCIVGGLAALLHFAVLIVLVEAFHIRPTWASALGFCLAVVLNYALQYYWTFGADGPHGRMFSLFAVFAVLSLTINTGVFWLCNEPAQLPYLLAQVVATGTVVLINFQLNRRYVFRAEPVA